MSTFLGTCLATPPAYGRMWMGVAVPKVVGLAPTPSKAARVSKADGIEQTNAVQAKSLQVDPACIGFAAGAPSTRHAL